MKIQMNVTALVEWKDEENERHNTKYQNVIELVNELLEQNTITIVMKYNDQR